MFYLSAQVFHTRASPRIDGSNRSFAEDYIRVMLDQTNMAETLRYIDDLAMAELQMVSAQTYVIAREGNTSYDRHVYLNLNSILVHPWTKFIYDKAGRQLAR